MSSTQLNNKIAIVTGGSRGIGAAIAKFLAARGATVVINYVTSSDSANEVVDSIKKEGGNAIAVQADMGTLEGPKQIVQATVEAYHKIDIIVNNAGVVNSAPLGAIDVARHDKVQNINVRGPLLLVHESLPYLQRNGRIINVSSIAARVGLAGSSSYGASKAALEAMSRAWASELGPSLGVTSNCINPGPTKTSLTETTNEAAIKRIGEIVNRSIMKRMAEGSDLCGAVGFLASEDSHWVTGDVISTNGGLYFL
ncbi:hypothetical protein INT43_008893 [Umbelopsis isabellina]|uniref:Ketoreductase domain-containing protein n=1 Tax=Mortierella isabellina TaxID=91625 RepID=A0A8H7UFP2_MORIS|nr:hypothetical protein INT43_008893 [Umbelopsis isabellina]